jgi:hypothetical protein
MPYITEIVDQINTKLDQISFNAPQFNTNLQGLCNLLPRQSETIPAVVTLSGSAEFSGFDDRYNVVVYHRCLSTEQIDNPNQFGDANTLGREQAKMRMIVFANRRSIQENEQSLAFRIARGVSNQFYKSDFSSLSGVKGIIVDAGVSNFDGVSVFTSEYKMPITSYPVQPEQIYFAMDYILTIDYDINCISSCSPC